MQCRIPSPSSLLSRHPSVAGVRPIPSLALLTTRHSPPTGRLFHSTDCPKKTSLLSRARCVATEEGRKGEEDMASAAEEGASASASAPGKMTMVVGVDDSDHSYYALQWALQHFFSPPAAGQTPQQQQYRLAVVTAKPTAASAVGLAGPGAADVLPFVEADLKKSAMRVVQKAKDLCAQQQVGDAVFEVVEGDARNVLCDAVERHHAEMLVVGSHGYGAIKRAVLGSVSDYCAHHAHCTVMIVKKPKHKHSDIAH